ncbi:hypothetical protein RF11_04791 [Thelohanellus kitauei]|uniref:Integrase catalytic domain-containing protein n=1 Tax=Thelohanellus kitauei TaxID=669202 RepID=A0A0C2MX80_THEKT|nr:hypothetical protein RF11_04791 [Thelohanellus kitauei]
MKEKYVKLNHVVDSKERLAICLFWYRNTIQHSTLRSPAESMMGRRLRCLMDNFKPSVAGNVDKATFKQKYFHDRTTQIREFYEGQKIWIKNELKAGYRKGVVVQKTSDLSYLVSCEGKILRKHADPLKKRNSPVQEIEHAQKTEGEIM